MIRAAWLYYVGGLTQDQIAAKLVMSRQKAQRLVSMAVSENIVKFRIDHPIASCLGLADRLEDRYNLLSCDVAPSFLGAAESFGISQLAAAEMEKWLSEEEPIILGIGTGRSLRAAVEELSQTDCSRHSVVSLSGNVFPDGSSASYNVISTLSGIVTVRSYPMPLPVYATSASERETLRSQPMIRRILDLVSQADVVFVGIGDLTDKAPLVQDGFITEKELFQLREAGAVGEIIGRAYDIDGRFIEGLTNERAAGADLPSTKTCRIIAVAKGYSKLDAIRGALNGQIINGLITDETTALELLKRKS